MTNTMEIIVGASQPLFLSLLPKLSHVFCSSCFSMEYLDYKRLCGRMALPVES